MYDNLEHYGVLGMKWGHHKTSKVSNMTSEELKSAIARMDLERRYVALKAEKDQTLISKGANVVTELVVNSAKQTVQNAISKQMSNALDLAISAVANKIKG